MTANYRPLLYLNLSTLSTAVTLLLLLFGKASIAQGIKVLPTAQQVQWADAEIGVIIHLDINIYAPVTFDYQNAGTLPAVNVFNPTKLNTDQWIKTAKAAGAKYAILTVKHGTGFCLWPSKINDYNVGHTSWRNGKADILKDFIASCKKYGLKPGLYYNTNSNTYYSAGYKPFLSDSAHSEYNKAVLAQLAELWGNYGKMFEIWFDGGITNNPQTGIEGQVLQMINEKQPQAILFQGPLKAKNIIRWIGNEDGIAGYPQWSRTDATTASNGIEKIEGLNGFPSGKYWCPGESDFPIRRNNAWNGGWLWKAGEESYLFTVNQLMDKYEKSVGRNSNMLIGMVVDTSGLIPQKDSLIFDSLGWQIKLKYKNLVLRLQSIKETTRQVSLPAYHSISHLIIKEDIAAGQHIKSYTVEAWLKNGWTLIAAGESVGHKRMQDFKAITTRKLRLKFISLDGYLRIKEVSFYQ